MKRILLTVGPRGAGKSTFCHEIEKENLAGITYANRDQFLVERYGKNVWDPYSFSLEYGEKIFLSHVSDLAKENAVILLEHFFYDEDGLKTIKGSLSGRNNFLFLIDYIDSICSEEPEKDFSFEALLFTTPPDICAKQFVDRQYPNETDFMREFYYENALRDSIEFYEESEKFIKHFDVIWEINPRQALIFPIKNILALV